MRHAGGYAVPSQGWKIHVGAIPSNAHIILSSVNSVAKKIPIEFKVYRSLNEYMSDSIGLGPNYSQVGKFITIYPRDYGHFLEILALLGPLLKGEPSYKVPFDRHIHGYPIYYRYGGMGRRDLKIFDPANREHFDDRTRYCPPFVFDPLAEFHTPKLHQQVPSIFDLYGVTSVISQRGKGGIYRAVENATGQEVVLKEGRKYGEIDARGLSGLTRVKNDIYFTKIVADLGIPTQSIRYTCISDEYVYAAVQYMDQRDPMSITLHERLLYAHQMIEIVETIHEKGIIHGDIKIENFMFADGSVRIIDFESAFDRSWEEIDRGATKMYLPKKMHLYGTQRDLYALAVTICLFVGGFESRERGQRGVNLRRIAKDMPSDTSKKLLDWLRPLRR